MKCDEILYRLSKSNFRSSFKLKEKDINYIDKIGLDKVREHAFDFINNRLKIFDEVKDGKQTPMRGHPVFIAQHATATCCRGCLEKWYGISRKKELNEKEVHFIVNIIMKWIVINYKNSIYYKSINEV